MHSESLDFNSALGNTIHSADTIKSAEIFQNLKNYCFSKVFWNYFFFELLISSKKGFFFEKIFHLNIGQEMLITSAGGNKKIDK